MDSILIILKKKMAQGLHLPLYWNYFLYHSYIQQISGERLQDHWSSCLYLQTKKGLLQGFLVDSSSRGESCNVAIIQFPFIILSQGITVKMPQESSPRMMKK